MRLSSNCFFDHIDDFVRYRQQIYELSPQTIKSNLVDLNLFKGFIESRKEKSINGKALIGFQYYLKMERGNCGSSINRKIFALRSYGNFLKLNAGPLAESLPFYDVLKIRQGYRNRPQALTMQHIKRLFTAIGAGTVLSVRDYAVYALMYQLGLRVGEVHALDLVSLDLEDHKITVLGKGRKVRTLHMNAELIEILSHYLAVRESFLNSHLSPALFISKKGNRLSIRTMEDNLKKVLLRADLKAPFNISCHTLRHSLASHLNEKGTDILVIQSILGHATSRSTEPYIHPSDAMVRKALEKLPSIKFVKELIRKGELKLGFQKSHTPKRE